MDSDGDGRVDWYGLLRGNGLLPDLGCEGPDDPSERASSGYCCDDGIDDDGLVDYPADPGRRDPTYLSHELTRCDDGIDNDGDGGIDWDGTPPDPDCVGKPYRDWEVAACGLGWEIAPALLVLFTLRRRARYPEGAATPRSGIGRWSSMR